MNKKTLIQVLMVLLIVVISLLFYLKYFNKIPKDFEEKITSEKTDDSKNSTSTYIDKMSLLTFL